MLGWLISVYRQTTAGTSPASADSGHGPQVATWQTGLGGLVWIDDLVRDNHAIDLGGSGYPLRYTAQSRHLLPPIESGPPGATKNWVYGKDDIIDFEKWPGETTVDQVVSDSCEPDEWLLVEAWDES